MMVDRRDDHDTGAAMLADVAGELGLPPGRVPTVRRTTVALSDDRSLSSLVWGDEEPEIVFLPGAGQNAHTWDLVATNLGCAALAIDLSGHGHSSWRHDRDVFEVVPQLIAALQENSSR